MLAVGRSMLKWVRSLNSVDIPGASRLHRFILSARLGLWPAILLSSLAFGHLFDAEIAPTVILATNLCLVASVAFLFNDAWDARIDERNGVHRWNIHGSSDVWLFVGSVAICLFAMGLAYFWLSWTAFVGLILTMGISIAYTLFCKRIFLLGNVVAAVLAISPGLIMAIGALLNGQRSENISWEASAFLGAGFLLLVSREIKFDEFDIAGDYYGNRATVPMILSGSALGVLHALMCGGALLLLFVVLSNAGKFSSSVNLALALATCAFSAALMVIAYRANSKERFYKTTRLIMLAIPISILLSF